jgi:hypothetical protein
VFANSPAYFSLYPVFNGYCAELFVINVTVFVLLIEGQLFSIKPLTHMRKGSV